MAGKYRRVIRITGADSPNVRLAMAQRARGERPTGELLLPGVLPLDLYLKRRETWTEDRQCVGLDAMFWEGKDVMMFPEAWFDRAAAIARSLTKRSARAIGIDTAEGGNNTAWVASDIRGVIAWVSKRTPDTSVIPGETLAFMRLHGVLPENVIFDRGGGGKQHADVLRAQGYPVRTVAFGESVSLEPQRGMRTLDQRVDQREEHYAYVNRRSEMYGELRGLLDPQNVDGFGIPEEFAEVRRQLKAIPMMYDGEGRMKMLPKRKTKDREGQSLEELIGCSPDESDALVLSVHGILHRSLRKVAEAF